MGPGRNQSVLIEVAARNQLLKRKGYHPARELARMLGKRLKPRAEDIEPEPFPTVPLRPDGEDSDV